MTPCVWLFFFYLVVYFVSFRPYFKLFFKNFFVLLLFFLVLVVYDFSVHLACNEKVSLQTVWLQNGKHIFIVKVKSFLYHYCCEILVHFKIFFNFFVFQLRYASKECEQSLLARMRQMRSDSTGIYFLHILNKHCFDDVSQKLFVLFNICF